jgi:hypothetical protein
MAVAVAGWLAVMAGSVLVAPTATAAPTATVEIKSLTPPVGSIDAGGTITFVNRIADSPASVTLPLVGGVDATVHTDVAVTLNGQAHRLAPGQSFSQSFPASTVGAITYTYRVDVLASLAANVVDQVVSGVVSKLPPAPVNVPFVVNTLVPLPNLPSVNLPQLPAVAVPASPSPAPEVPPVAAPPAAEPAPQPPVAEAPADPTGAQTVNGTPYSYGTTGGAAQLSPTSSSVSALANSFLPGQAMGRRDASGSGGVVGDYDGASVPVFGQLAGLDTAVSGADGGEVSPEAAGTGAGPGLTVSALAAFLALAGVSSALVRGVRLQRASR